MNTPEIERARQLLEDGSLRSRRRHERAAFSLDRVIVRGGATITFGSSDMLHASGARLRRKKRDLMKDIRLACLASCIDEVR